MATGKAEKLRTGAGTGSFRRFSVRQSQSLRSPTALVLLLVCIPLAAGLVFPVVYLVLRASDVEAQRALDYLTRASTLRIVGRSVLLVGTVSFASCLIGIPAAWLTTRTDLKARGWWTIALTLPLVIPSYVGAFALIGAIGPKGMLQQGLAPLGVERLPSIYGFWGAWLSITLFAYPYVFLSVRAGLKGIDPALEEASRMLGRTDLATFRHIILPQLYPSISAGGLLVALYTLGEFGAVSIMQYNVFTRAIYLRLGLNLDLAALLSLVLVSCTLILLVPGTLANRRQRYYTQRVRRAPTIIRLGRRQWVAQLFCAIVVLVALIAPVGVVSYWLINGLRHGTALQDVVAPLQRSMRVAALAAGASGILALPFVLLQVRYPHWISRLLARSPYLGYALPGVVVALAFVFLGANYLGPLNQRLGINGYRTLSLLVFAYVVRFLPQALGPSRAALLQVNPTLEESALTLGRSRSRAFLGITLPLMRSGIGAGIALVFLTAMKELPVTLLIAPMGYDTLATRIWSASTEALYARAAGPALILILFSALSLVYILEPDEQRT